MPNYTAPTFVTSYSSAYGNSTSPKTVSVTTQAGDVVVVYAGAENGLSSFNTPSGNSISFTANQTVQISSSWAGATIWSGTDSTGGTNWTLSLSRVAAGEFYGFTCAVFRNSGGVGASNSTNGTSGTGDVGLSLTTTQANSAVVVFAADWNIDSGTSRTWKTVNGITPSNANGKELSFYSDATHYIALGAYYNDVGSAGSNTYGYNTGFQTKHSIVMLEVKGTVSVDPPIPMMWVGM